MIAKSLHMLRRKLGLSRRGDERQTKSDFNLARRLYSTFESDLELAEIRGIHFFVQNGVATLYGTVRHELDRELLMSLVRETSGVKGVVTHLQLVDSRFQDAGDQEMAIDRNVE